MFEQRQPKRPDDMYPKAKCSKKEKEKEKN